MTGEEDTQRGSGVSRRQLCAAACAGAVAIGLFGLKALPAQALVRPPGGQDADRLMARCIRCGRCIMSCPWHVLRAEALSEGVIGAGLPVADFSRNWCDFCASAGGAPRCVAACPTGALELPPDGESVVLGIAEIVPELCLPWATGERCKRCYRVCPSQYRAIKRDKQGRPSVDPEKCVGCGSCQKACPKPEDGSLAPSANFRAIMVKPL